MASRFSRGSHQAFRSSRKRLTAWAVGTGGTTVDTLINTGSTFIGSAVMPAVEGLTVIRIRGQFGVYQRLATAAGDGFSGIFGIGIATLAAVTAGIASVPTPITEVDDENWLYLQMFDVRSGQIFSAGGAPGAEQHGVVWRFDIDSKAMRKLPEGMALYAACEVVETGAATLEIVHDSRVLVKLS